MIPDATFGPAPPSKLRLRFSLLALLIFVTLVCFGLAWLAQPTLVVATALFHVDTTTPTLLNDEAKQSPVEPEWKTVKKTQIALLKSHMVLNSALRNPAIAGLPMLQSQKDPVAWLQDHLEAGFPQDGEILAISLRGPEAYANDLIQIVDAVAKGYRDEVVYAERQRRLTDRDLLARSLENLNLEIARKLEKYSDIAREADALESGRGRMLQELDLKRLDRVETELMRLENEQLQTASAGGSESNTPLEQRIGQLRERQAELEKKIMSRAEGSVELTTRQRELDQLQRLADEMTDKLERLDIEAQAPDRIRQVQPAVVGRAK